MSAANFTPTMRAICASQDDRTVLREAMKLIVRELGEGAPAYLEGLEILVARLPAIHKRDGGRPKVYGREDWAL